MQQILLTSAQTKSHFSRLGLGFFAMLMASQLVAGVLSFLVGLEAPGVLQSGWFLWVANYLPLYGVGFPVFLAIVKGVPDTRLNAGPLERRTIGPRGLVMLVLIALGIVYPLNALATLLSTLVEALTGTAIENTLEGVVMGSNPIVNLLFVAVVAPVMEEIIFRGILYQKLVGFGGKVYIFFSAFMFALYHVNVYQLAYAFVLGLLFAAITYFTSTIKYAVFLHVTINLLGSGIGPLLYQYGGETPLVVYSGILLGMVLVGIVLGLMWVVRRRREVHFGAGMLLVEKKGDIVCNPGVLLMIFLFVLLMVFVLAVPYLMAGMSLGG